MEIERKYLFDSLPEGSENCFHTVIEQGYLCVEPVVRVRRDGDEYYLTYKSGGLMSRDEYNLPLTAKSYARLITKAEGRIITKTRWRIPLEGGLTAEADIFGGELAGLKMVEVEFDDEESAKSFVPPAWFGKDVTFDGRYHNSYLSSVPKLPDL